MKRFMVYFFGTDFERVKIGSCESNLYRRLKEIQTGCPDPIKLLGVILCKDRAEMKTHETRLHRQFQEYNTINEWFRLVSEISAYIEEFTESGENIMKEDYQCFNEHKYYQRTREKNREKQRKYQREYYQRNRKKRREYQLKYRQQPEVKERECKRNRERYHNNPEVRETQLERDRERYHNNPEVRKKKREDHRKWLEKNRENVNKRRRDRYRNNINKRKGSRK